MTRFEYRYSCSPSFRILDAQVAENFMKNKYPASKLAIKEIKEAGTYIVQNKSNDYDQVSVTVKEIPKNEVLDGKEIIRRAKASM